MVGLYSIHDDVEWHARNSEKCMWLLKNHYCATFRFDMTMRCIFKIIWRRAWDVCGMLLILYLSLTIPMDMSFSSGATYNEYDFFSFAFFIDLFFIFDILLNFNTSAQTSCEVRMQGKAGNISPLTDRIGYEAFVLCAWTAIEEFEGFLRFPNANSFLLKLGRTSNICYPTCSVFFV